MSEAVISDKAIDVVREGVMRQLSGDTSGHGIEHISRVVHLTEDFCRSIGASVRRDIAIAIALLHDVDDYKLVGSTEKAERQNNAVVIMDKAGILPAVQTEIKNAIASMGYSKALRGIRPTTTEGMVVSDADMCDAIGASGVVRALVYTLSDKGSGVVFDRSVWPNISISAKEYNGQGATHATDGFINHFFEKLLKLRGMMLTEPGQVEAVRRDEEMIIFLRGFFRDENTPEWDELLENFLENR